MNQVKIAPNIEIPIKNGYDDSMNTCSKAARTIPPVETSNANIGIPFLLIFLNAFGASPASASEYIMRVDA